MNRNRQISISSQRVRAILRVLFVVFSFLYFYRFQTPLLALVQHQLSEGQTTFAPFVSSVVLSLLLLVIQRLVSTWVRFPDSCYFFSYVPSDIFAVLLTAFTPTVSVPILVGVGVVFFCFIIAVLFACSDKTTSDNSAQPFSQLFAIHSVGMLGIFLFMGGLSHSNDVLTFELGAARSLDMMDDKQALLIGKKSLATSYRLTALRAYALSQHESGLGDSLFFYPMSSVGARQLMFEPSDTLSQLLPPDSLYAKFGVWPSKEESAIGYFERMKGRSSHPIVRDYWLSALLLEKNLDKFVQELPRYYLVSDSVELPRHYKEALSLYNHEASQTIVFKADSVMAATFQKFLVKSQKYDNVLIRKNQLRRKYGNTYWWYYYYQN